ERDLLAQFISACRALLPHYLLDIIDVLGEVGIDLQQQTLVMDDHAVNGRVISADAALELQELRRQELRRECDRRGRLLLRLRGLDQGKADDGACANGVGNESNDHGDVTPCDMCGHDRSTTRAPVGPASMTACASPIKRPCSTTPGMAERRSASSLASAIRCNDASRIQCPPSVTKAWPSLPCRSLVGPGLPAAWAAASTARRVAVQPNGIT